ncbi:MAG: tetratricopeptide repeat protein [Syntrophorhabdaceae bacterium]|nr:tetratricopeptide repeat protein [Syntrophorhabdaceae bacterium]
MRDRTGLQEVKKKEKGVKTSSRTVKGVKSAEACENRLFPRICRDRSAGAGVNGPDGMMETHPLDAKGYYHRGRAYQRRGDCLNAIGDYDRAIALDPRLAWAYYHRGLAHGDRGNRRQQVRDLKAAAGLGLGIARDILAASKRGGK